MIMKLTSTAIVCAGLALLLTASGCSTGGLFSAGNVTEVQLQRGNFKTVAHGVSGVAEAGYLLGVSVSMGIGTNTFALVRIDGSGMLYKEALDSLWKNFEAAHGAVGARKLALINIHYDSDVLNLFVYTRPRIMIRADVIEFTE
jgi:hypothetical protein